MVLQACSDSTNSSVSVKTCRNTLPTASGRVKPEPYLSTLGFCQVCLDQTVTIHGLGFRVFVCIVIFRYIILLNANYSHLCLIALFSCIAHLYNQNQKRQAPCPIRKIDVDRASTIIGLVSWELGVGIGYRPFYLSDNLHE
jgi:hypothetical protein